MREFLFIFFLLFSFIKQGFIKVKNEGGRKKKTIDIKENTWKKGNKDKRRDIKDPRVFPRTFITSIFPFFSLLLPLLVLVLRLKSVFFINQLTISFVYFFSRCNTFMLYPLSYLHLFTPLYFT